MTTECYSQRGKGREKKIKKGKGKFKDS